MNAYPKKNKRAKIRSNLGHTRVLDLRKSGVSAGEDVDAHGCSQ